MSGSDGSGSSGGLGMYLPRAASPPDPIIINKLRPVAARSLGHLMALRATSVLVIGGR